MQSARALLHPDLVRQAQLFKAMTTNLRRCLPAEAAAHCWVGGAHEQTLVVVTDSASFTVAAHYQQHEILKQINSVFRAELAAPLTRLRVKIAKTRIPTG